MGVERGPEIQASVQEDTQVWRGVRELRRTWAVTLPPPQVLHPLPTHFWGPRIQHCKQSGTLLGRQCPLPASPRTLSWGQGGEAQPMVCGALP